MQKLLFYSSNQNRSVEFNKIKRHEYNTIVKYLGKNQKLVIEKYNHKFNNYDEFDQLIRMMLNANYQVIEKEI